MITHSSFMLMFQVMVTVFFRALVESDIIPISDSKTFRSDLAIRTKTLLKNGSLHSRQIRNYFNNNENSSKGGSIEDYIDCVINVSGNGNQHLK